MQANTFNSGGSDSGTQEKGMEYMQATLFKIVYIFFFTIYIFSVNPTHITI